MTLNRNQPPSSFRSLRHSQKYRFSTETSHFNFQNDRKLQQALSDEWNSMEKESFAVDENVFKVSGRHTDQYFSWKQGHWFSIGSRLVKTFM